MTTSLNNDFNQGESFLPLASTHSTSRNERRKRNIWCPRIRQHTSTIAVATICLCIVFNICYGTHYASLSYYFDDLTAPSGSDASEEITKNQTLQKWIERAPRLATKVSAVPAKGDRPFVFFHLRKAGGSSLRQLFYNAAVKLNITQWTPCWQPI